jgi:transaldolase/glucose-6-phosphate isomerase
MTAKRQKKTSANPLERLHEAGQAIWLDFLSRRFIAEGGLKKLVEQDGLAGVTSNPSIFEKAIAGSTDYDPALKATLSRGDRDVMALYEALAVEDIQNAADALRPVYDATQRADGYVSLEVSPYLAMDTEATVAEARRLWQAVGRDNLMIKVPATKPGLPAIQQLIGEGINVNITLLFSQKVYEQVAEAYLAGLEHLVARGGDPAKVASVASFFVSRIDVMVDKMIDERLPNANVNAREMLAPLRGKVAIANAKLAYQIYKRLFSGPRWEKLEAKGARVQRLLWASTGTKNPEYSDVLYVDELIAPDTVNTLPPATMDAFRDHGKIRKSLEEKLDEARQVMASLERSGISIDAVTDKLVDDGVQLFADAFDKLLGAVAHKRTALLGDKLNSQTATLPSGLEKLVADSLESWRHDGNVRRLWAGDAALWTRQDEAKWLGWLPIVEQQRKRVGDFASLADDVRREGFTHVLLLGMGGSSLGPEVFAETFGRQNGSPELLVLDSTDPAQIRTFESRIDPAKTLFIVSSKSGSTLEPNILKQYFFECASAPSARTRPGRASSPSPIRDRRCRRRQSRTVFATSPMACRASAADILCFRISVWCRRLRWASTSGGCSTRRKQWCAPAPPTCRRPTIRVSCWVRSSLPPDNRAATRSPSLPRPASPTSAHGWNSFWPNRPASTAKGSSPSTPNPWVRPRLTARIACSFMCGSPARPKQPARAPSPRWSAPAIRSCASS